MQRFLCPPSFKPGEDFEYSNTNIILLGLLIEKTTGMDLATYLKKNIFNPLKLSNTGLPTGGDLPAPYAHGYFQLPDNTYEDNTFRNTSWSFAAGGMVSTLHDLKIWSGALGTGELLSKEEFNQRLKWKKIGANTKDYHYMLGLGFDNGWLMHTGTVPGYNTMVAYLPEKKAVFVCLINTDKDLTVDAKTIRPVMLIFKKIAEIILPQNIPASPLYND
jgi:D-alanyl-D-alanine carboxypeptidase